MSTPSLHDQIMNLHCGLGLSEIGTTEGEQLAFKRGHKQARNEAAELALEADAVRDELVKALKGLVDGNPDPYTYLDKGIGTATEDGKRWLFARAALANATKEQK